MKCTAAGAWNRWAVLLCQAMAGQEAAPDQGFWNEIECVSRALEEQQVFFAPDYLAMALGLSPIQRRALCLLLLAAADERVAAEVKKSNPLEEAIWTEQRCAGFLGVSEQSLRRALLEDSGACAFWQGERGLLLHPRLYAFAIDEQYQPEGEGFDFIAPSERAYPEKLMRMAERMHLYIQNIQKTTDKPCFLLSGQRGAGRHTLLRALSARLNRPIIALAAGVLLSADQALWDSLVIECMLHAPIFCVTDAQEEMAVPLLPLLSQLAPRCCCMAICSAAPLLLPYAPEGISILPIALALPTLAESTALWEAQLCSLGVDDSGLSAVLAARYRFTPGQIAQAARAAASFAAWRGLPAPDEHCLTQGCRRYLTHALGDKARRIEAVFGWQDLILPDFSKRLLAGACNQMRHRMQVFDAWGFGGKVAYGGGLSLLFFGPPGTGKTMAAQVVAGALGLELYKIDLSCVVSKYVGETEKNLGHIFSEAEKSQAILFFDEADVLFSRRTEVKDAHDKYNNMEAAYLLQKMEEYSGVCIMATNFMQNIDEAFKRRLKFIIEFPFPDAAYRLQLWKTVFPAQTPLSSDIDWEYLAERFALSGSNIKNIALGAAFLAAEAGEPVGMAQLLIALQRELYKSGKRLTREDFGEYYMLTEEEDYGGL